MSTHARSIRTLNSSLAAFSLIFGVGGAFTLSGASLLGCGSDTSGVFQSESSQSGGSTTGAGGQGATGPGGAGPGGAGPGGAGPGGAGQGGTGAGMPGPENCLDGVDNDGDGDTDCADSDCDPGYTCVETAPSGWSYTIASRGNAPSPMPEPCADGSQPEELFSDPAGPAECSACSCGGLQGAACSSPSLACYPGSNSCGGGADNWTGNFQGGACAKPDIGFTFQLSCRLNGPAMVTEPGGCPPSMVDFPNKEAFTGRIEACATNAGGGGCDSGSTCAPRPSEQGQSLCIRHDGAEACPAGWTMEIAGYKGATDTRACGACGCESAATCNGGVYRFYDLNNCGAGGDNPIDVDNNTCRNVSSLLDSGSWSVEAIPTTVGGGCNATGGQPTGAVMPENPVTFCCR